MKVFSFWEMDQILKFLKKVYASIPLSGGLIARPKFSFVKTYEHWLMQK